MGKRGRGSGQKPAMTPEEIAELEPLYRTAEGHRIAKRLSTKPCLPPEKIVALEQDDEKRAFIAKTINNMTELWRLGLSQPVQDDEQLCERLTWLFERCAETQQLVTIEKMGLAIGYSTDTLKDWRLGRSPGFSPATKAIVKQAMLMIQTMDADLAQEGRIQPVVYLFRAKNFYNMTDRQEVVVTPNNPLGDVQSASTIEAKYDELPDA